MKYKYIPSSWGNRKVIENSNFMEEIKYFFSNIVLNESNLQQSLNNNQWDLLFKRWSKGFGIPNSWGHNRWNCEILAKFLNELGFSIELESLEGIDLSLDKQNWIEY